MIREPQDIVAMFVIIALVVATFGFGISSMQEQGAYTDNTTFFSNVQADIYSTTGITSTADQASDVIDPSGEPVIAEVTEQNIITQGLQSLRSLAATYKSVEKVGQQSTGILGLDPLYITLITAFLIISLFIVIYTWARGVR